LGDYGEVYLMDGGLAAAIPGWPDCVGAAADEASTITDAPPAHAPAASADGAGEADDAGPEAPGTVAPGMASGFYEQATLAPGAAEAGPDAATLAGGESMAPGPAVPPRRRARVARTTDALSRPPRCKAEPITRDNAMAGTPGYMAPEMAMGDPERIGVHSDVYLLGAILYEIVTGIRPHGGQDLKAMVHNIVHNIIQPSPERGELVDIARAAMAADPADRPRDVRAFQQAIREYQTHAESLAMCKEAEKDLRTAGTSKRYDDFARAMFTYEQALKLWPENRTAREGARTARLAYANGAFEKGDYGQSLALLEAGGLMADPLADRVRAARDEREARLRRARTMTRAAAGLAAAVVLVVLAGGWWISREQARTAKAEREATAARLAVFEEEQRRREEWLPVCDLDFTTADALDPRFGTPYLCTSPVTGVPERETTPVPDAVRLSDAGLALQGTTDAGGGFVVLPWREPVGNDLRLEADLPLGTKGEPGYAILTLAGDGLDGYRLVIFQDLDGRLLNFEIDTQHGGKHTVLARIPDAIPLEGTLHTVRFEKVGSWLRASLDGKELLSRYVAVPLDGEGQLTFSLATHWMTNRVRRLRVWKRRAPELVPVLAAGRELLRAGHPADAAAFFQRQATLQTEPLLRREAEVLLALSWIELGQLDRAAEQLDKVVAAIEAHPDADGVHLAHLALAGLVDLQVRRDDFAAAGEAARRAHRLDPTSLLPSRVAEEVRACLGRHVRPVDATNPADGSLVTTLPPAREQAVLGVLAGLPLSELNLTMTGVTTLDPLREMRLKSLTCARNAVADLSPLRGMPLGTLLIAGNRVVDLGPLAGLPLERLGIDHNRIENLEPLRGMELRQLLCGYNPIRDLSPLRGMPLSTLLCEACQIDDLAPLQGLPLQRLDVRFNFVTDLSPLRGAPLKTLYCDGNAVADLSPLAESPLEVLGLGGNRVRDLSPLAERPRASLRELWIGGNEVSDLAPLAGMQLRSLSVSGNPVTDLAPLRGMPLQDLDVEGTEVSDLAPLADMPLVTLSVAGTQVTDLAPLAGLGTLRSLDINGIPLTDANLRVAAGLRLASLGIDLRNAKARALVRKADRLTTVNGCGRDAALRALPLLEAIESGNPAVLRQQATPADGRLRLLLPVRVSWAEADALARRAGGRLPDVRDADARSALDAFCKESGKSESALVWVDLRRTPEGAWQWRDGTAVDEASWLPGLGCQRRREGDANRAVLGPSDRPRLLPSAGEALALVVIEWPLAE
ncbi:MAG: lectin-like protein, partial [Planctomycetota bacterium]